jgi:5,10-methylenetetrahydromethanopterin reductase
MIGVGATYAERLTFNLGADSERLRVAIDTARAACAGAGVDPSALSLGAYVNVAADPDLRVARDLVRGSVAIFAHYLSLPGFPDHTLAPADRTVVHEIGRTYDESSHGSVAAPPARLLDDAFVDRFAVVGTPAHCAARLSALLALGLDRLVIVPGSRDADPVLVEQSNRLFAAEVLPRLR